MSTLADLAAAAVADRKLTPRDMAAAPGWQFWELRTLNIHRVVGLWRYKPRAMGIPVLEAEARATIRHHFKRSWWRGMAYGVIAEIDAVDFSIEDLRAVVDVRDNRHGTFQWLILVSTSSAVALGVHTWVEGYLSPVYRSVMNGLSEDKYQVASVTKAKDGLMSALTEVADVFTVARTLGMKRTTWDEFRDEL